MFVRIKNELVNINHVLKVKYRQPNEIEKERDIEDKNIKSIIELWFYRAEHPGFGRADLLVFFDDDDDAQRLMESILRSKS